MPNFMILSGVTLDELRDVKLVKKQYKNQDGEKKVGLRLDLGDKTAFQYTDKKTGARMWSIEPKKAEKQEKTTEESE